MIWNDSRIAEWAAAGGITPFVPQCVRVNDNGDDSANATNCSYIDANARARRKRNKSKCLFTSSDEVKS